MADTFVISGLRRKRAHLAGEIEAAQKALTRQRATLANLDATNRLFEPEGRPVLIPAIRPVSRTCLFFRRGELQRLCLSTLREAGEPATARFVTDYAKAAKGLDVEPKVDASIANHVHAALMRLEGKGVVRKIVTWPDVWWVLAA